MIPAYCKRCGNELYAAGVVIISKPSPHNSTLVKMTHICDECEKSLLVWLEEPRDTVLNKYKEINTSSSKEFFKDGDMYRLPGSYALYPVPKAWPISRPVADHAKYYRPIVAPVPTPEEAAKIVNATHYP